MSMEQTTLEIIAPSVDEAVARGLNQLGLSKEMVEIEVLDSGSKGLFGLGSRQARVRLKVVSEKKVEVIDTASAAVVPSPAKKESEKPQAVDTPKPSKAAKEDEDPRKLEVSKAVVSELLEKMHIKADVSARYEMTAETIDQPTVVVDIQGDDLSILIGRRSETLNALQYISSLIIGKELGQWTPLMIDVQGYRTRRERQLRQLARRMADQAIHTGRRQVLEPMSAAERRIIHLELRDHDQVFTESTGEEPNRKVTIVLKKN